jgi:hypothetical protein
MAGAPPRQNGLIAAEQLAQGLGADRERFDALWGLWMINNTGGAPDVARGITSELFQIADQLDDATLRMEAHHACWASANTQGEHAATIEHVRQGLAIYDSDKHGAQAFSYGGHDTAVCGKAIGGRTLWALGYPDQAICSTDAAITSCRLWAMPRAWRARTMFASFCRQSCRDAVAVLDISERHRLSKRTRAGALSRARRGHSRMGVCTTRPAPSGLAELKRNLEAYDPDGRKSFTAGARAALAEVYFKAGDTASALQAVDAAWHAAEQTSARGSLAGILNIKGEILASMTTAGRTDAETCFLKVILIAGTQKAKSVELRAATSLARLRREQGRRAEARDLLAPVYGWFTEGFDTPDLKEAKALLDELA